MSEEQDFAWQSFVDHESRIRILEVDYRQINRKLDFIMFVCWTALAVELVPLAMKIFKFT